MRMRPELSEQNDGANLLALDWDSLGSLVRARTAESVEAVLQLLDEDDVPANMESRV